MDLKPFRTSFGKIVATKQQLSSDQPTLESPGLAEPRRFLLKAASDNWLGCLFGGVGELNQAAGAASVLENEEAWTVMPQSQRS